MNNSSYTRAEILLIKAAEDEAILASDGISDSILGFHAQQAVEKLVKALLSALATPFELTHNLDRLQIALNAAGETLPSTPLPLDELSDFAVIYRYDLLFQVATPDKADSSRPSASSASTSSPASQRSPLLLEPPPLQWTLAPAAPGSRISCAPGASKYYAHKQSAGSSDL